MILQRQSNLIMIMEHQHVHMQVVQIFQLQRLASLLMEHLALGMKDGGTALNGVVQCVA